MQTLNELAQYIRETLPQAKTITNLQVNDQAGVITFHWQGREFLVRKSMDVLEVKGKNLFLTGASMLLQTVLLKKNKNEKVVETAIEVLQQAEDLIGSKRQVEAGLKLLTTVKGTLTKLAKI